MREPIGNRSSARTWQKATVFGDLRGASAGLGASSGPPVGRPPAPAVGTFPPRSEQTFGNSKIDLDENKNPFNWRVFGLVTTGVAFTIGFVLLITSKEDSLND